MPDFLKRILLLVAITTAGWKAITLNAHNLRGLLIALVVTIVAGVAIWKWEFR